MCVRASEATTEPHYSVERSWVSASICMTVCVCSWVCVRLFRASAYIRAVSKFFLIYFRMTDSSCAIDIRNINKLKQNNQINESKGKRECQQDRHGLNDCCVEVARKIVYLLWNRTNMHKCRSILSSMCCWTDWLSFVSSLSLSMLHSHSTCRSIYMPFKFNVNMYWTTENRWYERQILPHAYIRIANHMK